ncbi:spore germination protein [Lachnotalea glycerini]|uniref:LysM peptidoglycan-binding domain-containing protein n=1 Tax=Lachnotalea glycerini TaxID=1763509 RepID=A0A318EXJ5_9FIRM|nr:LysM peptidoglycan-binding domain-containing protein [Lachnotalea glycerini]PXV95796.1 spore germination protein [Lachnotalea glycerini]RDY33140.1 LysM peptidoglycan-binding domain-containing protein [Lachnotalea glycerini]
MEIYVVKPNDTLYSISRKFNVPLDKLILDNGLQFMQQLVPGQTIVIVSPAKTYIVQEKDTLNSVSMQFGISQMQLFRNNPFLTSTPLAPGMELTISYNTTEKLTTCGYIYPYIDKDTLRKTLPSLTYLTIYNYRAISEGKIITYSDDSEVIQLAKDYGTIPLMLGTTLSLQGEPDTEAAYSLLLKESYQDILIENTINIIKEKGYLGANIVFNYINQGSVEIYQNVIQKLKTQLDKDNLILLVTINPNTKYINNELAFDKINYDTISKIINKIVFLQFIWGINYGPPLPVNSITKIKTFIDYVVTNIHPKEIMVGLSLVSYNWQLPYIPGSSYANSLSLNSSLRLAQEENAVIQFDEVSQSPYFTYINGETSEHIVWSVDARTISSLSDLITQYNLHGAGFWNLMVYTEQLWLVVNSQYEINKFLPNIFDSN